MKGCLPLTIQGLVLGEAEAPPSVLLSTPDQGVLTVEVGPFEASALLIRLEGIEPLLPLTHDLTVHFLVRSGWTLNGVEFYDLSDAGPRCRLHLQRGWRRDQLDVRPSDALALALRLDRPIWVQVDLVPVWRARCEATSLPDWGLEPTVYLRPSAVPVH